MGQNGEQTPLQKKLDHVGDIFGDVYGVGGEDIYEKSYQKMHRILNVIVMYLPNKD